MVLKESFFGADITHSTKFSLFTSFGSLFFLQRNIAFAPLSMETPLTSAASYDVKTGWCSNNLNSILWDSKSALTF